MKIQHLPKFVFCLVWLVPLGCSTSRPSTALSPSCLNEGTIATLLPKLEKVADLNASSSNRKLSQTKLVENGCQKRIYIKNDYRIIFYRELDAPAGDVQATLTSAEIKHDEASRCLDDALALIRETNIEAAAPILEKHKGRYAWRWNDADLGPVKWLSCKDRSSPAWFERIDTLLHELNHENKKGQCLFIPSKSDFLCFNLSPNLPLRSLAKLESYPTQNPRQIEGLKFVERFYLTDTDQPPHLLFDELHSYIITTRTMTAITRKFGPSVYREKGSSDRQGVLLPLFLLYTVRYLNKLSHLDPKLYRETFGARSTNWNNIRFLLTEGESAYLAWLKTLESAHESPKEIETNLWDEYKTQLKLLQRSHETS
jgi:hypothetical protein